jgi:hypothetical protein
MKLTFLKILDVKKNQWFNNSYEIKYHRNLNVMEIVQRISVYFFSILRKKILKSDTSRC